MQDNYKLSGGEHINNSSLYQLFVCFAAEDRYDIVEPVIHHLKNYGINIWYDRYAMMMGDNRQEKNIKEGARNSMYTLAILSKHTNSSACAMEELSIVESRYNEGKVTVFPVFFELSPDDVPIKLQWIKDLVYKEVNRNSGTREICNHIACKITGDILSGCNLRSIQDIINANPLSLPCATIALLQSYQDIDNANFNSRITLLYAVYLIIIQSKLAPLDTVTRMIVKIFERLFSETRLNLHIDYRELWLLENSICILINCYLAVCTESNI